MMIFKDENFMKVLDKGDVVTIGFSVGAGDCCKDKFIFTTLRHKEGTSIDLDMTQEDLVRMKSIIDRLVTK